MKAKKWFTQTTWVELETGEVLSKSKVEREYIILNNTSTVQDCGAYNLKIITYECEKNRQLKIQF